MTPGGEAIGWLIAVVGPLALIWTIHSARKDATARFASEREERTSPDEPAEHR